MKSNADIWRDGAIRGLVFALIFIGIFEGLRLAGVSVRLSQMTIIVLGVFAGAGFAAVHGSIRVGLNNFVERLKAERQGDRK